MMKDSDVLDLLTQYKRIAVVGLSPEPDRPSHHVTAYMIEQGYEVMGVRPGATEILGRPVYSSLTEVPLPVEIVDVFRASEHVPTIVDEAIKLKAKVLWLQEGVSNDAAEKKAMAAGMQVVSNRCILKEHARLMRR